MNLITRIRDRFFPAPKQTRDVFTYWDGERRRSIDPMIAHRRLWTDADCDLRADARLSSGQQDNAQPLPTPEDVFAAEDRILDLVRRTFGVKAYAEGSRGLTIGETFAILARFLEFTGELKRRRARTQPALTAPTVQAVNDAEPAGNEEATFAAADPDSCCP